MPRIFIEIVQHPLYRVRVLVVHVVLKLREGQLARIVGLARGSGIGIEAKGACNNTPIKTTPMQNQCLYCISPYAHAAHARRRSRNLRSAYAAAAVAAGVVAVIVVAAAASPLPLRFYCSDLAVAVAAGVVPAAIVAVVLLAVALPISVPQPSP